MSDTEARKQAMTQALGLLTRSAPTPNEVERARALIEWARESRLQDRYLSETSDAAPNAPKAEKETERIAREKARRDYGNC